MAGVPDIKDGRHKLALMSVPLPLVATPGVARGPGCARRGPATDGRALALRLIMCVGFEKKRGATPSLPERTRLHGYLKCNLVRFMSRSCFGHVHSISHVLNLVSRGIQRCYKGVTICTKNKTIQSAI